ncbi:hypothetical protein Sala_1787 [Sphingopyxis alaskensis RB2256]|uniref:Uncharacterized protein n=1 Tax=Sphingopyxis alaskensis (strain DSM 13593 / LMG 18877 / RB2256) TaxID=317655 RepID=Q1GS73_SPHAL|nr:hypothetical protein Sala_1787 [Sphingopyxis alaskensis RB2256]
MRMTIGDIVSGGQIRTRAIVMQQKTGCPVQFELLPDAGASLLAWLERRDGRWMIKSFPAGSIAAGILAAANMLGLLMNG